MTDARINWAPVPLRIIIGFGFMYHGWPKLFSTEGHAMFLGMLQGIGVPGAEVMAWLVGALELFGGAALMLGAFTPIVSALLIGNMAVAILTVHLPNGFNFIHITGMAEGGPQFGMPGYEVPLLYIAGLAALLLRGPGYLSLNLRAKRSTAALIAAVLGATLLANEARAQSPAENTGVEVSTREIRPNAMAIRYSTVEVDGLDIFYREAGPVDAPTVLLLHGFPTSSHMFRNLIPALADQYHVVAPDYPGFGNSSMPSVDEFEYTFDRLADVIEAFTDELGLTSYSLYVMDYGAPVGFRLAVRRPERVEALIVQNGNAYVEGLLEFWDPIKAYWNERSTENGDALRGLLDIGATKWQYTHGTRNPEAMSPDGWNIDQRFLDRPGNQEIMLALFYDYGSNPGRYPVWQAYFREFQPPTLIVWGKNDHIFPADGAYPYRRDLENVEFHLLDTGHFALEEDGDVIASLMRDFLARHVGKTAQ